MDNNLFLLIMSYMYLLLIYQLVFSTISRYITRYPVHNFANRYITDIWYLKHWWRGKGEKKTRRQSASTQVAMLGRLCSVRARRWCWWRQEEEVSKGDHEQRKRARAGGGCRRERAGREKISVGERMSGRGLAAISVSLCFFPFCLLHYEYY